MIIVANNLQSALKSPPSTTGAAEETVGGSLNTAEKLVWLKCFKQWISGDENGDDDDDGQTDDLISMAMMMMKIGNDGGGKPQHSREACVAQMLQTVDIWGGAP